ncbi:MAG: DUF4373 domain-containing protein [Janthinobacterium sp.]|jgi:hypothetical protein
MGNDIYYFSHDSNARNDEKVLMLRAEYGWEGYGLFWALIEMMFEKEEICLSHNKIKGLSLSYNIDITLLEGVINSAINNGLFESDSDKFWSNSLRNRKLKFYELKEKRSLAGKKGMSSRWQTPANIESDNSVITKDNKGKERKGNKRKVKEEDPYLFINQLKENPAFKGIDVDRELALMDAWLLLPANHGRKKTQRFILSWLSRVERVVPPTAPHKKAPDDMLDIMRAYDKEHNVI